MPRFFLEVSYKGTNYSGFQIQNNANTIQAEVEKAIEVLFKTKIELTGSSRTDAGVHAIQNFFHFDANMPEKYLQKNTGAKRFVYNMNAILPDDISVRNLFFVGDGAHCRFDAISREYNYYIYFDKDPFLSERAFFFPYTLDFDKMKKAATIVSEYKDFTSFSKRNTQVKTFICSIEISRWIGGDNFLTYNIKANRFLRGMVRSLTATMLKVGRNKLSIDEFRRIIEAKDSSKASFAAPPYGLFLTAVKYPSSMLHPYL